MCSGSSCTTLLLVLVEIALGCGLILIFEEGFHSVCAVFFQESTKLFVIFVLFVNVGDKLSLSDDSDDEQLSKF